MSKYNITPQWLAGFIDGEGCFNISRTRTTIFPRLLIANTNLEILEAIKEKYGGDIKSRKLKENWKTFNLYRASWKIFKNILNDVLPYLNIKKDVAILCSKVNETKDYNERLKIKEMVHKINKKGEKK